LASFEGNRGVGNRVDGNHTIATRGGELGVQLQYLDSKVDFVDDALTGTVAAGEKLEVTNIIVFPVAVNVVNGFFREQFTSEMLGHDISMFKHRMFYASDKARYRNPRISVTLNVARCRAFLFKSRECGLALMSSFAGSVTKFLLSINPPDWNSAAALLFSALKTGETLTFHRVFSSAEVRTRHAAIHRIFAVPLLIDFHGGWFVRKNLAAFFAVEVDQRYLRSNAAVNLFVRGYARFAAKTLLNMTRLYRKFSSTLRADLADWHRFDSSFAASVTLA
jgi:hypothetical protein